VYASYLHLPSSRYHLSYDYCVEDKREITRTVMCCAVYDTAVHNDTQRTHIGAVLKDECWFRFIFVRLFRLNVLCVFTARRSYASAVLGVVILSVRPSVRLSQACFVTNPRNLPAIFLYHMKGQSF